MIEAFSLKSAHLFGDALASQAKLRYKVFVGQRALDHRYYEDMEYDEFDTPGAVYFVWRDDEEIVRGLLRLLPTTIPYMLKTYWPHLVTNSDLPASPSVREITRLCVDRTFDSSVRVRILPELLCAMQEYCVRYQITHAIGVTRQHLIQHFIRDGLEWLGPPDTIEGETERAFLLPTEHMRPSRHCEKLSLKTPVLTLSAKTVRRIAA